MEHRYGLVAKVGMIAFFGLTALSALVGIPVLLLQILAGIAAVGLLLDK